MTYKVVFLDIDGTILQSNHTYSDKTKDAIRQLQQQGLEVFLATGRPIHEIQDLAKDLHIDSFIGYNGAYAMYNKESIVDEPMDQELVKQFVQISEENEHEIVMYTTEKNYLTRPNSPVSQHFCKIFELNQNDSYTSAVSDNILGLTLMNLEENQDSLYQLRSDIRLSQVNVKGVKHAFDVIRSNVNKGVAIQKVLERLNISKSKAIAFGDGLNDKEMLQAVGESFAMGNANPDLFQFAKHKTAKVNDDGVFLGLQKLGLVK